MFEFIVSLLLLPHATKSRDVLFELHFTFGNAYRRKMLITSERFSFYHSQWQRNESRSRREREKKKRSGEKKEEEKRTEAKESRSKERTSVPLTKTVEYENSGFRSYQLHYNGDCKFVFLRN